MVNEFNEYVRDCFSEAGDIVIKSMMAEKYELSLKQAAEIFDKYNVLPFIREGYGIFHIEGDEAIFEEVKSYLLSKGSDV